MNLRISTVLAAITPFRNIVIYRDTQTNSQIVKMTLKKIKPLEFYSEFF